jgi:predicted DNA-binding transcriptional regulator AlpA
MPSIIPNAQLAPACDKAGCGKSKIYSLISEGVSAPSRIDSASRWVEAEVTRRWRPSRANGTVQHSSLRRA